MAGKRCFSQPLGKWLDRSCSFATAIGNVASSALSGFYATQAVSWA
jgi:hypothetical protein